MFAKMTMEKDVNKIVEGYEKYTGSDLRIQKITGDPGTTPSKSDLEDPDNIIKYRSFVGQSMWYTTKVVPDVANSARELAVHISHPGPEHYKTLGHLIGYLKGKETKGVIIIKHNVMISVMFCDLNYATYKNTIKRVSVLLYTIEETLLTCLSRTHRTVALSSMEA